MLNITEETHRELYYDVDKCVDFCKNLNDTSIKNHVDFHMYWRVGKDFGRKQILPIKSYLCTQDLKNTTLNIWSNVDLTHSEYLKPFLPYLKFHIWDAAKEARGTPISGRSDITNATDELNWASGDLFRILCLYKYGGLYADFDVVYLKNLAPVLDQEFMYKWSFQENMINGAVMRMFKNSELGLNLLQGIADVPRSGGTAWSTDLYERVRNHNKNWTIFPCGFFNTEWQIGKQYWAKPRSDFENDQLGVFIRSPMKQTIWANELFDGVFTWHWHNCWDEIIEEGSKWRVLEIKFNQLMKEKFKLEF